MTGGKGTNHDKTSAHTGEKTRDTELTGHLDKSGGGSLSGSTLGLVDLGEQGVGGLGDDGSGHTGDETGRQVKTSLLTTGERVLGLSGRGEDLLDGNLEDGELGHGVWDLLEENGTETGVEGTGTLLSEDTEETTGETVGERRLGDKTDTGSLKRAEGNVGEELGDTRGTEVDGLSVLTGSVDTDGVDGLLLPELVTSELKRTLDGVTDNGGTETGKKGTSSLLGDNLSESTDHTLGISFVANVSSRTCLVVNLGLELDSGLNDIDGGKGTVGDGTSESTSKGESGFVSTLSPCPCLSPGRRRVTSGNVEG